MWNSIIVHEESLYTLATPPPPPPLLCSLGQGGIALSEIPRDQYRVKELVFNVQHTVTNNSYLITNIFMVGFKRFGDVCNGSCCSIVEKPERRTD